MEEDLWLWLRRNTSDLSDGKRSPVLSAFSYQAFNFTSEESTVTLALS